MGRIADAQQAGPVPDTQPIDGNSQQLDVRPVGEFANATAQIRGKTHNLVTKGSQAALAYLIEPSFRDHIRALPVVPAMIEHHEDSAGIDPAQGLSGVACVPRQPHPQHVHRSAEVGAL
jgi:hypothetical protein